MRGDRTFRQWILGGLLATLVLAGAARADVVTVVQGGADVGYCDSMAREQLDGTILARTVIRRSDSACIAVDFNSRLSSAADGTVAFATSVPDQGIAVMGPGGFKQLTVNKYDARPALSPDGSRIAFVRFIRPDDPNVTWRSDIYVMNIDGSGLQRLSESDRVAGGLPHYTQNDYPVFSPDGSAIAYWCAPAPPADGPAVSCGPMYNGSFAVNGLMIMASVDGGSKRMVVQNAGREPAWSPDGTQLAFADEIPASAQPWHIALVHADGRDLNLASLHALTDGRTGIDLHPSFSPDGLQILYAHGTITPQNFLMDANGANQHAPPLVGHSGAQFVPSLTGGGPPALVPPDSLVPDVLGRTLSSAKRAVAAKGFRAGKVSYVYSRKVRRGRVVGERPRAWSQAPAHSTIQLIVSRGRRR